METTASAPFKYVNGELVAEGVPLRRLAEKYGTPLYVYSRAHLVGQFRSLSTALRALRPLICYSVKTNSNAAVIHTFARLGAGADVVSGGELFRALRAGVPANRIVFAGVGKTPSEIEYALRQEILFFTVESEAELERIAECARRARRPARVAIRVNPDVAPKTHRFITTGKKETKFGLDLERAEKACIRALRLPGVELTGLHMHIGSQILQTKPYVHALERLLPLFRAIRKHHRGLRFLDVGGGLGISYHPDQVPLAPELFAKALHPLLQETDIRIVLEPGRFLTGNGGVLLASVQYVKRGTSKQFVIVDAGMNDLIRPPLYQAHHEVLPIRTERAAMEADVVGPVCESADFLALSRRLPRLKSGDLLAIMSAGAYGFSMSSNYNSRCRAAEVMVSGNRHALIRRRETYRDLVRHETSLPPQFLR